VNDWLRQRSARVTFLIWGGGMGLAYLVGAGASEWIFKHHLDPAYLGAGAVVAALVAGSLAAWQHRLRPDWPRKPHG
jgi:protein-S-isoprenylcysteine O-methyltransferase Ste14